jgi:hypothetical protein
MKTYSVQLSRVSTQVWFLILFPIASMVLLMGALIMFADYFSDDTLLWSVIVSYFVLLMISSLLIIRRYIMIPAQVSIDGSQIIIKLAKRNMFYSFNKLVTGWNNVKNASVNVDKNTKQKFVSLKLIEPSGNYLLMAKNKKNQELIDEMWAEINHHINNYNTAQPVETKIAKRDFYSGPWMRLLAFLGISLILALGILIVFSPEFRTTNNILKVVALLAFLIPFLINHFKSKKNADDLTDL